MLRGMARHTAGELFRYSGDVLIVWLIVALVAALLWSEGKRWRPGVWLTKPLASAAVVALAVQHGALESTYGRWILAGLLICWLGDVLLIPHDKAAFRAGILSFLVGHLFYSAAFVVYGVQARWVLVAVIPLGVIAWVVGRGLLRSVDPAFRTPVLAYILVISGMLALGVGAWADGREMVFLAAPAAFYLSDLAVARNRFLHPGFVNRLVGLPLYYGAQILFAWSVTLR